MAVAAPLPMLLVCLLCLCGGVAASGNSGRFLLVSTPRDAKIGYARILGGGRHSEVQTLVGSGLVHPQGMAVDQKRKKLLVADPDARKVFAYDLRINRHGELEAGEQVVAAEGVEARWVAVDGLGTMFVSDETQNQILRVSASQALRGDARPEVVYDGVSLSAVNAPGGVAADTFHTYWVNKHIGSEIGSVARGSEQVTSDPANAAAFVQTLARNSEKSYGVCLTLDNVYYTQPSAEIYGVKKSGGAYSLISKSLTNPRGCVWDGDGTVYVADRGANAVFSFAGNMRDLHESEISKALDFDDAFGLAVFSRATAAAGAPAVALFLAAALATLLA